MNDRAFGRYRRRPQEVDAVRLTEANAWLLRDWCNGSAIQIAGKNGLLVDTRDGLARVAVGEWLVRYADGSFARYDDARFNVVFEPCEEAEP